MSTQPNFTINNENDLFKIIEALKHGDVIPITELKFKDWPKYEVKIKGEDFNGGVPTRIMPAFMKLQQSIDKAYALSVYGEPRRLTKDEKSKTEIIVHLESGSTQFYAELADLFNTLLKEAAKKMTGDQFVITILGVASLIGGTFAWEAWLAQQALDRDANVKIEVTKQETERYRMIVELAKDNQSLSVAKEELEYANNELLKRLSNKDMLFKDEKFLLDGTQAKQLVAKIPEEPIDIRLDGNYIILNVQSGAVKSGYKATIQSIDDDEKLSIDIPEGTLTSEQIDALKEGEWAKKQVFMEINAKKRGNKILKATLSQAGLKPSK